MGKHIHVLPTLIANQIAAGEVVERPASVVKELLENALDAGADHIQVALAFGGLNSITVSDTGQGIYEEDLKLAVMPHATSKIKQLSDLSQVQTMGFRGEALASIASISRFTIQSRPSDQATAMQLNFCEEDLEIFPCARNPGTTIIVEDLFFNAPVRKRFLKSERTEFLAIDRLVRCFALAAPNLGLDFYHNEQLILSVPKGLNAQTQFERVKKVLGKTFAETAQSIQVSESGVKISGWIAPPDQTRTQQDRMWVYVNQRMVNDKLLNHAIKQAYADYLSPGRYPSCLLYLEVNPQEVDVNVHPTKHELRFHHPRILHDTLVSAIRETLGLHQTAASKEFFSGSYLGSTHAPGESQTPAFESEFTHWTPLNINYAIVQKEHQPYLLDVLKLRQDALLYKLKQLNLPLLSRPLYVPITVYLPQDSAIALEDCFDMLGQVGITLTWACEERVLVRSIPVEVPHLQLQPFLQAMLKLAYVKPEQIFELFTQHQGVDAHSATEIEKNEWLSYFYTCPPTIQASYARMLTLKHCQLVFSAT